MRQTRIPYTKNRIASLLIIAASILLLILFGASFGVLFLIANSFAVLTLLLIKDVYKNRGNQSFLLFHRLGVWVYALFLLSFIIIEGYILYELKANQNVEEESIDYVVILGAGLQGEEISRTLETRLEAGAAYVKQHPNTSVIVSGGQGPGESMSEAEAMGNYLVQQGIEEERILYEKESKTTFQNLTFTKQLLQERGQEEATILIVTSDYHLVRATILADKVGLESFGLHANSPLFVKINYFIREYFAIIKTWVVY